jgi:hypothetical protein
MVGGIRTAIEILHLTAQPMPEAEGKSRFLSNINDNDSRMETSALGKFSGCIISSQANSGIREHDNDNDDNDNNNDNKKYPNIYI